MTTETYNGYTNYETWAVSLWLDNEEGSQAYLFRLAQDKTRTVYSKANEIKELLTDMAPDLGASVYADLLGVALERVNWVEVIKSHEED